MLKQLVVAIIFFTFISVHYKKVWVFVLKSKDQVLDVFKHLHANV